MPSFAHRPRLASSAAAVLLALAALAAHAQADIPRPIDIPAQPLDKALVALARQSGARIVFSTTLTERRNAPGVAGSLTVPQALERLLAGTGLAVRATGQGGYTVVVPQPSGTAADGSTALPTITVNADAERELGDGPVAGYVARRTTAGTKTDTPIIEIPQTLSVVTRQQMDDQRPASLVEALEYTPGVFTGQIGATNRYDYIPLRGFIETSTDNTVLDGLKVLSDGGSYSSMQVDPYLVERVDVYRGPSSVLFGRNAPGGLVAMTSKRPLAEPFHEAELTVGNRNRRQLSLDATGPVGGEGSGLAYRVTGVARENGTQFDHVKESRYAIAPSLQYQPDGRTRVLLQAYLQNDPEGGYHGGVPVDATVTTAHNGARIRPSFFEGDPGYNAFNRKQRMLGYQVEHHFDSGWTARQNFRYLASTVALQQVYAFGWAGPTTLTRYVSGADEEMRAWTIDNQVQRDFATGSLRHTLLAGLDYQHRNLTGAWYSGSATPIDVASPQYGNAITGDLHTAPVQRTLRQTGLYLQDQIAWERWRFTVGGRWDDSSTSNLAYGTTNQQPWSGSKFSKRAGAVYLFDSGLAPYASYSESFNPSGFVDAAGQVLQPTESRQVEAGLKYEPAGGIGMVSVAAFNLVQDHVATRTLGTPYYVPAGKVRSRGVEAEARLQLGRNLALLAGYTYTDAQFTRSEDTTNQGKTPYQAPRHMASLWADHAFGNGVTLGAGVRYVGTSWADNANTLQVPGYTLMDLALRLDLGRIRSDWHGASLRLNVKNLADKTYVASCASLNYCYYGEPRRVTATLGYQW